MGAHALGAAAYAAKAAGLAAPDRPEAVSEEIRWQIDRMSAAARAALRELPPVGENASGPLGPGLLASGFSAGSSVICRPAWRTPTYASLWRTLVHRARVWRRCFRAMQVSRDTPATKSRVWAAVAGRPRALATRRRPHPPPSPCCPLPVGSVNGAEKGRGAAAIAPVQKPAQHDNLGRMARPVELCMKSIRCTTGLGSGADVDALCRFLVTLSAQNRGFGAGAAQIAAPATRHSPHPPVQEPAQHDNLGPDGDACRVMHEEHG